MIRRPPRSTRTDTLFPYTTLFRSSDWRERVEHGLFEEKVEPCAIEGPAQPQQVTQHRALELGIDRDEALSRVDRLGIAAKRRIAMRFGILARHDARQIRSEERRVGKECVRTGRSWW